MDTKLKKSHKFTTVFITLCILIPSFVLTALCPRISETMREISQENTSENAERFVDTIILNYAMEACYSIYGNILEEQGETVDYRVLEEYGWDNDYWRVDSDMRYMAEYKNESHSKVMLNATDMETKEGDIGTLTFQFSSTGRLEILEVSQSLKGYLQSDEESLRSQALESVVQYNNNVIAYEEAYGVQIDEKQLLPKNLKVTFIVHENSSFIYDAYSEYWNMPENLLWKTGAFVVICLAGLAVMLAALILPFFKRLHTGWEKLFCVPLEVMIALGVGLTGAVYGMYVAMAYTCAYTDYEVIEIVGVSVGPSVQYGCLLALNLLGWAACFFLLYVIVASIRQFFCGPMYYLKNRILIVRILRWCKKQLVRLYRYVTDIHITENLNKSIVKIVLANFVILTILCALWLFGVIGLIIYSVLLYVLLRKYGEKIQKQYSSVLHATEEMAEGNLKVDIDEDLGVFEPIGTSLGRVKEGFSRAVMEEAKSQNMKSELITNVSHDLKTPLTAIITYVDLLKQETITEEERRSYIQTLDQKSQRLKALIEDLFEVSKAQSGNVTMNFMDVDVVSLMKQVRLEMEDRITESNLTFRWNMPEEKLILSLDGQRTYRVFENLIQNALKYAMPYTRVYVDVLQTDRKVQVIFRNISAEEIKGEVANLTERFVRGDVSRNSEGSGLGLAIAKSFVELQNGLFEIDVDGDLFKVTLTWSR